MEHKKYDRLNTKNTFRKSFKKTINKNYRKRSWACPPAAFRFAILSFNITFKHIGRSVGLSAITPPQSHLHTSLSGVTAAIPHAINSLRVCALRYCLLLLSETAKKCCYARFEKPERVNPPGCIFFTRPLPNLFSIKVLLSLFLTQV